MRLLHTSDWHLGRSFHGVGLLDAQAAYVDHLVGIVRTERVDVVLVAGDVYDRALPPVDAVSLADEALRRLAATGAHVVLISGNHDSARRLGFGAVLLDVAGVHLRTDVRQIGDPVVLTDAHGDVAVYGLPYLEPDAVRGDLGVESLRGHEAVLTVAMSRVRDDLASRPKTRSVTVAHAFVAGGSAADSERDISVGGVACVPAAVFAGVDYVALGHLHGAQVLPGGLRYSGSPLAYSFAEAGQVKSSWLVELDRRGVSSVERVPTPVPRPLSRLVGRLDDLLADSRHGAAEGHFVWAVLTDDALPAEPMARLRRRFPHTVRLSHEPAAGGDADARSYAVRLRGRSDVQISVDFVEHVRGVAATAAERDLLAAAFAAQRGAEAAR